MRFIPHVNRGWEIKPLSWAFDTYKFGFNGKIKDKQIAGGALDYGARIYSSKIGRWLSTDPLFKDYPSNSDYSFALNTPVFAFDFGGLEVVYANDETEKQVETAAKNDPEYAKQLQILKDSDVIYKFTLTKPVKVSDTEERQGGIWYDGKTININFHVPKEGYKTVDEGKYSTLYHETEHGVQFEFGEVGFRYNKEIKKWVFFNIDITEEIKAHEWGFKAPGAFKSKLAKSYFSKTTYQKGKYLSKQSKKYEMLFNKADVQNVKYWEKNNGKSFDGKQKTIKTDKAFYKTHVDRNEKE